MTKKQTFMFFILVFITACTPVFSSPANGLVNVSVSILPEKYFVERVGGDLVSVNVMVGPGDSPHTYEPKVDQMKALSNADVYFAIGVEFEKAWMARISAANANMVVIDLGENIEKTAATENQLEEKNEGEELDPHIWTSPALVSQISKRIYEQLAALDPENQQVYLENLNRFDVEIATLQNDIQIALTDIDNLKFMVFHPSWGYFAQEFGLEQLPIEVSGTEPSPAELIDIIEQAKQYNIKVIFAQPEFSTQSAQYIAGEIGGEVILVSPLAENWLENMREVANKFASTLK